MQGLLPFITGTVFGIFISQNYNNVPNVKYYFDKAIDKIKENEKKS